MRTARALLILAITALPAFADVGSFREWANSPEAMFMTKAEKAEWANVRTEAEGRQFVDKFIASRGAGFREEVAQRVAAADKYLTVGGVPGSKGLRGKVIILLGPPSGFSATNREIEGERSAPMSMYGGMSGDGKGGGGQGASVGDVAGAADRQGMSGKALREFSIHYDARKLPSKFDRDLTVVIDADPSSGKDRLADQKQMKDLDQVFELAAEASIKK